MHDWWRGLYHIKVELQTEAGRGPEKLLRCVISFDWRIPEAPMVPVPVLTRDPLSSLLHGIICLVHGDMVFVCGLWMAWIMLFLEIEDWNPHVMDCWGRGEKTFRVSLEIPWILSLRNIEETSDYDLFNRFFWGAVKTMGSSKCSFRAKKQKHRRNSAGSPGFALQVLIKVDSKNGIMDDS